MSASPTGTRPTPWTRTRTVIRDRFQVDLRALAVVRIAAGALILVDLFYRCLSMAAFYTDQGVFPRASLLEMRPYFHHVSLHALSGDLWLQVVLFSFAAIAALALIVGFKTRIATIASFILMGSLHARNPFILNSGDSLLLLLLFWGIFLPLGARYSLDARNKAAPRPQVADVASAAILLQVVIIYSMNAFFKIESGQWVTGDAIANTFLIDRFSTPLGRLLVHFPPLIAMAGWFWLTLVTGSFLLIATTGWRRTTLVALFASFHFGMFLFMRLGIFPLISMTALLLFLPPSFWDRAETLTARLRNRLPAMMQPKGSRDTPTPTPSTPTDPITTTASRTFPRQLHTPVVSIFLVLLLLWSGFSLGVVGLPDVLQRNLEGHERSWAMFANPSRANIWYVAPAQLENNETIDALHGDTTPWDHPAHVDPLYPDIRWRKYLAEFHRLPDPALPDHFATYLCHKHNHKDPDNPMMNVTIYRIHQPIEPTGPNPPGTPTELVTQTC